jgi:acetolactate decarboxylase
MTVLFNANTRSAYQAGYYTGALTIRDLLAHGDVGLGALEGNDGELVINGGRAYRTAADGSTTELPPEATTPYATVVPFTAGRSFPVSATDRAGVERLLAASLPLVNRTWALRIHGSFEFVTAGASQRQQPPYAPLEEVMATYRYLRHTQTTGTLVAFHCPAYLTGIDYVGAHYHWLSDDHTQGGHVAADADFAVRQATVEACEATSYTVELPTDGAFYELDLTPYH